jgi:flagellar protein FlaG
VDIKPVGNNNAQPGQRVSDTGNFIVDMPSISARQGAAPVQTVNAVQQPAQAPTPNQVKEAVDQINTALKAMAGGLQFSIDSDVHRTVVKVLDPQTQQVLRQMPSEDALEIAKALDRAQGLIIKQKA